jgi:hypothetical protein
VCVDKKSHGQTLERTQPMLPRNFAKTAKILSNSIGDWRSNLPLSRRDEISATETQSGAERGCEATARAAYFKAYARGFAPDHELADCTGAERELVKIMGCDGARNEASAPAETQQLETDCDGADGWFFYEYPDGRWTWLRRTAVDQEQSGRAFDSWIEALANAIARGFTAGISDVAYEGKSRRSLPRLRRSDARVGHS